MIRLLFAGAAVLLGAGLVREQYYDRKIRQLTHGPWDHWEYRGRRINRGQRIYIPETGETVKFTGRCVYIRDRSGHEDRIVINGIALRNGRASVSFTKG